MEYGWAYQNNAGVANGSYESTSLAAIAQANANVSAGLGAACSFEYDLTATHPADFTILSNVVSLPRVSIANPYTVYVAQLGVIGIAGSWPTLGAAIADLNVQTSAVPCLGFIVHNKDTATSNPMKIDKVRNTLFPPSRRVIGVLSALKVTQ